MRWTIAGLLLVATATDAFAPRSLPRQQIVSSAKTTPAFLFGSGEDETVEQAVDSKKKTGLDKEVRSKLLAESIAPWRSLRLFIYAGLASGALLGGLITLSGVAAALSGARDDVDLNTEYLNLAIDFGAVAAFAFLGKFDLDKQKELSEKVDEKMERKKEQKKVTKAMQEREKTLSNLLMEIQVSADGQTRQAPVAGIQAGAKQHIIIVAGPKKACKDALIGANLLKMDFAMSNVLVVPYEMDAGAVEKQTRPTGGFGDRPVYESQPYVGRVAGEGWEEYINAEMEDAVKQNGEKTRKEGIAIVIANNGKIIRRGVGTVPWRQMVEQLEETADPTSKKESYY